MNWTLWKIFPQKIAEPRIVFLSAAHTISVPNKEVIVMDKVNHNIECSVNTCAYHAGEQNYCTLNTIKVGCCGEPNPKSCDCTECASFKSDSRARKSCGC